MAGTSNPISFSDEGIVKRKNPSFTPVAGYAQVDDNGHPVQVTAPELNPDDPSPILTDLINPYPEYMFDKLLAPDYGPDNSVARYTGEPVNRPDFIKDYTFTTLMRATDSIVKPRYTGRIEVPTETPVPAS